jgi:hypothetical protein
MKLKLPQTLQILPVFLLAFICFTANAQKLPATQQVSLWIPANIKVDGKADEWNGKFQAYNSNNHLFYTIANNDKNLYLIVYSTDRFTIQKIVRWGVALTVSNSKKSKDPNNVVISFPIADEKKNLTISKSASEYNHILNNKKATDSLMKAINVKLGIAYKEIQIAGIKEINDPSISVYNMLGIKAVALFDNKLAYTYELAIPLKYINGLLNSEARFSYNIKLNGGGVKVNPKAPPGPVNIDGSEGEDPNTQYLFSPTDFWGEYTLAKK